MLYGRFLQFIDIVVYLPQGLRIAGQVILPAGDGCYLLQNLLIYLYRYI